MTFFWRSAVCFLTVLCLPLSVRSEVLWDNWYTESQGGVPHSYYHEKVEIQGEKVKIMNNRWIREGKAVLVENLGAVAKNTTQLQPLLYNFRRQSGETVTTIDGSILKDGKIFSVKIKPAQGPTIPLRAEMLPDLILSSFFPVWIVKNYKRITGVQPIEFRAILEDQVQNSVPILKGDAYEMLPDDYSKKTETRKIRVVFAKLVNFWYVNKKGETLRITIPALSQVVDKSTQATAEKFL